MIMQRRTSGQSIVEMAFVLPVLLFLLFGIIEFGYVMFAYSTVSQAARNAAESAAQLPPYQTWLTYKDNPAGVPFMADSCVSAIYFAARSDQTMFTNIEKGITISYPDDEKLGRDTRNLEDRGPIQVTIRYHLAGITPLFQLLRLDKGITLTVTQRRSIENLGVDPSKPGNIACAKDVATWRVMNP